jgi:hypothetical protein
MKIMRSLRCNDKSHAYGVATNGLSGEIRHDPI